MGTYYTTPQIPVYRAATTANVVAPADPTAFFLIEGSATKDVIVERITVSGPTIATAAYNSIVVEKFSTAASGGTATALVKVPLDSKFAAATVSVCQVYTAAPTEGTLVGTIDCRRMLLEVTTVDAGDVVFDFTDLDGGGVLLRGVAQGLGVALGADPATAVTLGVSAQWREL